MFILYADDEKIDRELVEAALLAKGHQIFCLDSSKSEEMTRRFKTLCEQYGAPAIFILDGHNVLRDTAGNKLFDMTPLGMVSWLRQNGLSSTSKVILYSNDDALVEQARTNRSLNFFEAVPKSGLNGGLLMLLKAIERATKS